MPDPLSAEFPDNGLLNHYVKFIRLSESLIEKNGEGVLGFITNHGYLDNPTFRGMRWHLLNTFDRIHVLDLHGNSKKKEMTPAGKSDNNVFDIQQGVAIIIAVKTGLKNEGLAELWHGDLWGDRETKYLSLEAGRIGKPITERIDCTAPQYAFARRDHALAESYASGIGLAELMPTNSAGIVTMGDGFAIADSDDVLRQRLDFLFNEMTDENALKTSYGLGKNYSKWIIGNRTSLKNAVSEPITIAYRPFDAKRTLFDNRFLWRWRKGVMKNYLNGKNIGLLTTKAHRDANFAHAGVVSCISEAIWLSPKTGSNAMNFPLYLYPSVPHPTLSSHRECINVKPSRTSSKTHRPKMGILCRVGNTSEQELDQTRRVNFDPKLYKRLQRLAKHPDHGTPNEVQVFDYIYGVLHCPAYRETYAEFLKIDFPRIPWPATPEEFWEISGKGETLRKLHLMDAATNGPTAYPFTGDGDNVVDKPRYDDGKVWINPTQYFDAAPEVSWGFYIGGYQPAQKWLKDRKGRALTFDDVKHYQRILKILSETDRIMQTIEMDLT